MKAYVTDAAGEVWELPAAERWELEYGVGTPCDSFLVRCPWRMGLASDPKSWVRFYAEQDGARVFTGVVDECEVSLTGQGCSLELSGRGIAALLLDNEALGQDYQLAAPADILRDHVTSYGIETVGGTELSPVEQFRVDTGSSEWTVVEEFVRRSGGITPRFDVWGRMVLSGWGADGRLMLDDTLPVSAVTHRDRRYGVLSEILVRDRYSGAVHTVRNEIFSGLGGRSRRVLTMPGHSNTADMEVAGQYQLERSAREWEELEVTLPLPFYAMPGRLVEAARTDFDYNGTYRVWRSVCGLDGDGYWTRLTLRPEEI